MAAERTEEQKVAKAPIVIVLGDTTYEVKPLRINAAESWRAKFHAEFQEVMSTFGRTTTGVEGLVGGMGAALIQFPAKVRTLVFEYDTSLPVDKIMEEATEEQIAVAFSKVMVVAYPFLAQLAAVTQVMAATRPRP